MHTSLTVESGDWGDDWLLIDGAVSALLDGECVRIVPQLAYRLVRGDLGKPVHIDAVKIPLTKPMKVLGIGRTGHAKY